MVMSFPVCGPGAVPDAGSLLFLAMLPPVGSNKLSDFPSLPIALIHMPRRGQGTMTSKSILPLYTIQERSREVAMRSQALRWRARRASTRSGRLCNDGEAILISLRFSILAPLRSDPERTADIPARQ